MALEIDVANQGDVVDQSLLIVTGYDYTSYEVGKYVTCFCKRNQLQWSTERTLLSPLQMLRASTSLFTKGIRRCSMKRMVALKTFSSCTCVFQRPSHLSLIRRLSNGCAEGDLAPTQLHPNVWNFM